MNHPGGYLAWALTGSRTLTSWFRGQRSNAEPRRPGSSFFLNQLPDTVQNHTSSSGLIPTTDLRALTNTTTWRGPSVRTSGHKPPTNHRAFRPTRCAGGGLLEVTGPKVTAPRSPQGEGCVERAPARLTRWPCPPLHQTPAKPQSRAETTASWRRAPLPDPGLGSQDRGVRKPVFP